VPAPPFLTVDVVNEEHAQLCGSPEWAAYLQEEVLPPLVALVDLGPEMLELGPGPGAATDWLRRHVVRLVAVEREGEAAERLRARFAGTNVEIVEGDACDLPWPDASFDTVGCFTMLHHVPTPALQQRLLAEALRVLRPGGALVGSDSLATVNLHHFHAGDTYNPVEPAALLVRLQALGYGPITLVVDDLLKFVAYKPRTEEGETP
jgi:SAM-dependent methyltransferase